ncbi:MAG: ParB/RepB/Spo0J family partition protein [Candidatus Coatesbacteria bacterium]|nr:ParB/RepB/Spo0J family partition protein [Candidatus Coatesbacteria bacterium]
MKKTSLFSTIERLPVKSVPVEYIYINKERRSLIRTLDEELIESIKQKGLFKPVILQKIEDKVYMVIIGERRFLACRHLNLSDIQCKVCNFNEEEIARLRMVKDVDWKSLTPMQEAKWYQFIINRSIVKNRNELAKMLDFSRSRITQKMNLLHLPESVQDFLIKQPEINITEFQLRPLLQIEDPRISIQIFNELIEKGLTAQQVKDRVDSFLRQDSNIVKIIPAQPVFKHKERDEYEEETYRLPSVTISEPEESIQTRPAIFAFDHSRPIDDQIAEIKLQLEGQPDSVDLAFRLGHLYYRKGLYADSINELERVVHLQPDHLEAYYYLGCAYNKMEHLREAEVALKKAIELNPEFEKAFYYLGIVYDKMRYFDQAKVAYYKVKEIQDRRRQATYGGSYSQDSNNSLKKISQAKQEFLRKVANLDDYSEENLEYLREMLIEITLVSPGQKVRFESFVFQVQSTDRDNILWVYRQRYDSKYQVEMDLDIDITISENQIAQLVEAMEEYGLVYVKNES